MDQLRLVWSSIKRLDPGKKAVVVLLLIVVVATWLAACLVLFGTLAR